MVTYISAEMVYPVIGAPIKNGILGIAADGTIQSVLTPAEAEALAIGSVTSYRGILVPGMVNTHCHLELSHLKGKIEAKTGLTNFIRSILSLRGQPESEILTAMGNADEEMYANGIVAVGDISNVAISKAIKLKSKIYYHTFVEVFGFNAPAAKAISDGLIMKEALDPLKTSIVPHAPYSVSSELFHAIKRQTGTTDVVSIHNQETAAENELFEYGTGKFADFFASLGIAQSDAHGSGTNAINNHLPQLSKDVNTLLVHNTFTNAADLDFAKQTHRHLFWCLCPNANLYIENTLPDVGLFRDAGVNITMGTDSLASNHQLNLLAEMQTLQDQKNVPFVELLKWGTLNGAMFLGIESLYGSFSVGKKPGVILLGIAEGEKITADTTIKRLF